MRKTALQHASDLGWNVTFSSVDQIIAESFRNEQLGYVSAAIEGYRRALEAQPGHPIAATRMLRLLRDARTDKPERLRIVWQTLPSESWESDWLRYLMSGLDYAEIVDGRYGELVDGSIVVDNRLTPPKVNYYVEMLRRGNRFVLVHWSDEGYLDDCSAYPLANAVIRNYWSRAYDSQANVLAIPLGMMNGFEIASRKPARDRRYLWSFAGNVDKSSRRAMLAAMAAVEGGHLHCADSIGPQLIVPDGRKPLPIEDYARLLSETVFAPCPGGWDNLDSFRVCEALEAGCIPIVERRPSFDYFRHLFGEHPMVVVDSWNDAPGIIAELGADPGLTETRRVACEAWWQSHKRVTAKRVQEVIRRALG